MHSQLTWLTALLQSFYCSSVSLPLILSCFLAIAAATSVFLSCLWNCLQLTTNYCWHTNQGNLACFSWESSKEQSCIKTNYEHMWFSAQRLVSHEYFLSKPNISGPFLLLPNWFPPGLQQAWILYCCCFLFPWWSGLCSVINGAYLCSKRRWIRNQKLLDDLLFHSGNNAQYIRDAICILTR